jgi:ABC-2 type transport system permease protein
MRAIGNIILKEARELLTPQMLAPFLAMMVIFLAIGRAIRSERERSGRAQAVLVADADSSELSQSIVDGLRESGLEPEMVDGSVEELLALAQERGVSWVIAIPAGLADSIERMRPVELGVYNVLRGFSLVQQMRSLKIRSIVSRLNARLVDGYLGRAFPGRDPAGLREPLRARQYVMMRGRVAEGSADMLEAVVMSQTFFIPIVLLMIIIYSSQMIAGSIGQEKENKTLETLLTVPVNRVSIVVGKMVGASLVALVVAGIFMVAMIYYMGSWTGDLSEQARGAAGMMQQLDIGLTLTSYLVVGVALFLAVLCALSLATLLAIFADDAKSAQVTVTPLMMLVMVPYLFTMLFDINTVSLPVKVLIYAIPFSYPFLAPKAVFFGDYLPVIAGFGYMALFAAASVVVAARVFASDRILTAKLRWGRKPRVAK